MSFDEQRALALVGGDRELLREIAGIYVECYAEMVQGIRDAIASADAAAVKSAAHLLKGSVASFSATAATAAAAELELMGRNQQLEGAAAQADIVIEEATRLAVALEAYAKGG